MFLVFKTVTDQQLGLVKRVGQYLEYVVGWLDDSVKDIVPIQHLRPTIIENEGVALAWKFAGNYSGYISVRPKTLANEQLQVLSSLEADNMKARYFLTEEDKQNTVEFMKIVLRKMLDEVYDRRFEHLNIEATKLEFATWQSQLTEAWTYKIDPTVESKVLEALANARGITKDEMADKIIKAHKVYESQVVELLSKKQSIEKEIKDCEDIAAINVVIHKRFGYNMPVRQQQEMGIQESSTYDL